MERKYTHYDRGYDDGHQAGREGGYSDGYKAGREEGERRRDDERSARMGSAAVSASKKKRRYQSTVTGIQCPSDPWLYYMPVLSSVPAEITFDKEVAKKRQELESRSDQDEQR